MKCPLQYTVWTPDEIAECTNISKELYKTIWNKIVPKMEEDMKKDKNIKEIGYMEYPDQKFQYSMERYWDMLTEEEQNELVTNLSE